MTTEVQGVIARSKGAPVEITTIVVPDPGPGEALVDVEDQAGGLDVGLLRVVEDDPGDRTVLLVDDGVQCSGLHELLLSGRDVGDQRRTSTRRKLANLVVAARVSIGPRWASAASPGRD